jgi:hypothetical protein
MIYERYRGSDTSKTVPRRLAEVERCEDTMSCEDRVKVYRELLRIEKEPNTRGFLLWRIGREYLHQERHEEGFAALAEARKEFDPLLGTINDVMDEYCRTLYYLILDHFSDLDDFETTADLAQAIVVNLDKTQFTEFEKSYVLSELGHALTILAKQQGLDFPRSLALACYLRWHHLQPEEPGCLERLAYAYFCVGDLVHCRSAIEMCLAVAPAGELRDRIEEFARENARVLGRVVG